MTHPKLSPLWLAISALTVALGSPAAAQCCGNGEKKKTEVAQAVSSEQTIVETAVAAGSFKTLVAAVKAAGLVEALQGDGPFTVFAPTDAAFAKLPKGTLEHLLTPEGKPLLKAILTFHVVPGRVTAKQVMTRTFAPTLNGQRIAIDTRAGVRVSNAKVIKTDIGCSNGVIHVIDSVIMPTQDRLLTVATKAGTFKTLAAAIKAAGLAKALSGKGPFTVFAPTDAAFKKLPAGTVEALLKPANKAKLQAVLKLHVIPGRIYSDQALKAGTAKALSGGELLIKVEQGVARVNGAKLLNLDIQASNGVIHVIDSVLLPKTKVSMAPLHEQVVADIHGKHVPLSSFQGKVVLIVNTASQCGYTRQYAGLETLYQRYKARGLVVLGFPSNDFGGQEPGSESEILAFCSQKYGVTFPLFSKVKVRGAHKAPLYELLSKSAGPVSWNFGKYLIGRDGKILTRFDSGAAPLSKTVTGHIEKALNTASSVKASSKRFF